MKFCPRCIAVEVNEPTMIDDDEEMCGYCFDAYVEMMEGVEHEDEMEELVA